MNAKRRACYKDSTAPLRQLIAPLRVFRGIMDPQIKRLCVELLSTQDRELVESIGRQLRSAIHEYIENLRGKLAVLPLEDGALITNLMSEPQTPKPDA